ncbi:penicillin-binding protein 1C [Chitiniphilus purpureus]|uniref:peptidoglycan glycosyltransferase n=1 Tax=Chitiniphilus purpureus TaxID=2981137 RepID=A0ABY6DYH0_9NEIS|nr:penicillin-binding protein 1C [Chitiniphilus sp. CD1]UXY16888.1 penicillin-binding protein 1C [Chitiniphilus sp. CD1]
MANRRVAWPWRWLFAVTLLLGLLALVLDRCFPLPLPRDEAGLVVVDRHGRPLRQYPSAEGMWRHPVTQEAVSPLYLQALIHYEDRWFYHHPGVNPVALLRAAWQWMRHGRIVSGGSTLTMQVARILAPPPRTLLGKTRQILRALQLEWHLSKREILALYLNHAPMGGIVEGVEMASRAYLGKPAAELSHAEAALLAALPQAPSRLRPDRSPLAAMRARDKVLARLAAHGVWSDQVVADARIEQVIAQPPRAHWLAPLAAERLRQAARRAAAPAGRKRVVAATLDARLQAIVERMLLDRLGQLPPKVSTAVLVMENTDLAVRAYAGSADFGDNGRFAHVDMVRAIRSPGSTLKPFLYAMALDQGLVHSESLLADTPQSFGGYQPGNFQAAFSGPVSVADALQRSLNVPAVDLLDRIGPERFATQLAAAGLRLRMPRGAAPNLSLILGGGGTSLEALVGAYRALAAGGMAGAPRLSLETPRREARLMSPGAAWIVRDILEGGGRPDRPFQSGPLQLAWKTGTSFGFRDAWAVGVTDSYTIGVWVGRPDGTPNPGFFGANVAAPLLKDLVAALPAVPGARRAPRPAAVGAEAICWPLGLTAAATAAGHCHERRTAWLLHGTAPPTLPDRNRSGGLVETVWLDPRHGLRVTPACAADAVPHVVARWPLWLEPWLDPAVAARHVPPRWAPGCAPEVATTLRIVGVAPGSLLRPAAGRLQATVDVTALGAAGVVFWLRDGELAGQSMPGQPFRLHFSRNGRVRLTAFDGGGRFDHVDLAVGGILPPP